MKLNTKRCDHGKNKVPGCPICLKRQVQFDMKKVLIKDSYSGSSPAPFIGRFNYPNINVGILSPQKLGEGNWIYDAPKHWAKNKMQIPDIVGFRSELVNARFKSSVDDVKNMSNRFLEMTSHVGMASKPVDFEVSLDKVPNYSPDFNNFTAPTGPKAGMKTAKEISNPKIDRKVDRAFSDSDLKATGALKSLYKSGFDENFLSKALSVGSFGVKTERKLVPTRWSITATDDTLGKGIIEEIKDYPEGAYETYFGSHLGNYYLIMFFPGVWSYELFEMLATGETNEWSNKGLNYATDFENYEGRKGYVDETAGGYYAPRLAILEHLKSKKRQGAVLALRFITDEYTTPLGVWVTREATRNSLSNKPIEFSSSELMVKYALMIAKKKFGLDISGLLRKSKLLDMVNKQHSLKSYF
jgi:hypothetical protein